MTGVRVLDPGPIPYARIALHGDPDLEHALREEGLDPARTTYRLIEIPVAGITGTQSMPDRLWNRGFADVIRAGGQLPPLVVFPIRPGESWGLLDGVNRTNALVACEVERARAYELIDPRA